jgi:hypothetical protein
LLYWFSTPLHPFSKTLQLAGAFVDRKRSCLLGSGSCLVQIEKHRSHCTKKGFALGTGIGGEVVWSRHLIGQLPIATSCQLVYRTNLLNLPPAHARLEAVNDRDSSQMKQGPCIIGRERVARRTFLHISYLELTGRTFLCVE